jgi:vesicle-fusing ATPase
MTAAVAKPREMTLAMLRQGLDAALDNVATRLRALAEGKSLPPVAIPEASALPTIARTFNLNDTELALISLAAGHETDPAIGESIKACNDSGHLDLALVRQLFGPQVWDLLCPEAPLRFWRIVELVGQGPLHQRRLQLDERILHALLGTTYIDARLEGLLHRTVAEPTTGLPGHPLVRVITAAWRATERLPVILLGGPDPLSKRALAAAAAAELGVQLYRLRAADIPADWAQRSALAVLLDREMALSSAVTLIETEADNSAAAATLTDLVTGPTILSAVDPPLSDRSPRLRLELRPPGPDERRKIWRDTLGTRADALGTDLDRLATQFTLDAPAIAAATALAANPETPSEALAPTLWSAARAQGRRALDGLAERIESSASWNDLVLPPGQLQVLQDLAGQLRDAWCVNHRWGWAVHSPRGLGAAALFAGPSGTGKTLAAEVIAGVLSLDVYRIDLSQVVSKYIGETEKNLARIFAAAENGGAILLFDEADALFGKRSEVKDSHDRYANVEVSYLLQKMEAYRGLAILTTNQKSALDTAFLRRLRYIVNFPFPDAAARAEIWKRIFPDATPSQGLDPQALARLSISGGSIRSVALNATYLAAAVPEPVQMTHIHRAARREFSKLEKNFTATEQEAFR